MTVSLSGQIATLKREIARAEGGILQQAYIDIPMLRAVLQSLSRPRPLTQGMIEAGIAALGSDDTRDAAGIVVDVYRAMEATWLTAPMGLTHGAGERE